MYAGMRGVVVKLERSGVYVALFLGVVVTLNLEMYLHGADFFVFLSVNFALIIIGQFALAVLANRKPRP